MKGLRQRYRLSEVAVHERGVGYVRAGAGSAGSTDALARRLGQVHTGAQEGSHRTFGSEPAVDQGDAADEARLPIRKRRKLHLARFAADRRCSADE
jgi:hypothetical protein